MGVEPVPLIVISFDLLTPNKDYSAFHNELSGLGCRKILYSQYVVRAEGRSVQDICRQLARHLEPNDRLLVTEVTDCAARNGIVDLETI
jgi:hypothetical protein